MCLVIFAAISVFLNSYCVDGLKLVKQIASDSRV